MPELPEVETVTRALRPHLVGRRIVSIDARIDRLREPVTIGDAEGIRQSTIKSVRRRAKYILVQLESRMVIVMHLGMSGSCRIEPRAAPLRKHDHVVFELDNGHSWRFNDPRRFGVVRAEPLGADCSMPVSLQGLPPEPLGPAFDGRYLYTITRRRKRAIKLILLDSHLIAGVGNIYACEALFDAGIRPRLAAGRLSQRRCEYLVGSVKNVLEKAVQAGGTTIADFRSVDGSEGSFAIQLRVYGREGALCTRCEDCAIRRVVDGGRSTFFCRQCQR